MSNLKLPNMHVMALEGQLERAGLPRRGNYELKLAYQTFARKLGNAICIRHHSTVIAQVMPYSVIIRNGGYHSRTTANRLDKVLADNGVPFRVGIRQGRMELRHADTLKSFGPFTGAQFVMVAGLWEVAGVEYH